jgi:tripartite-type tricarboxylate transporter receptor subunit TctC
MRQIFRVAGSVLIAGAVLVAPAAAQSYPDRYVRIITAGTGSFHDVVARQLAQRLSERWGQGVVVENQPAAGLTIGAGIAAKAAPDGYTLLLADRTCMAVAPHLYKNLRYDPVKDFRPITLVARGPAVVTAHPTVPAADLRQLVAYARAHSPPILFASAGPGTMVHLTGELLRHLGGIDMQMIHYKGSGAAVMAMLSGEAPLTAAAVPAVLPQIRAGKLKALAVANARRFAGAPDIPTSAEAGLPGLEGEQWLGMVAPVGIPDGVAAKLNRDIGEVLGDPAFKEMLLQQGAEVASGTPAEFAAFVASESARLKQLIETTGVRMD